MGAQAVWRILPASVLRGGHRAEPARLLEAHLAASVFIGSTLSHFRHTSCVRPVLSVMAIKRFLHRGQRLVSIGSSIPHALAIGQIDNANACRLDLEVSHRRPGSSGEIKPSLLGNACRP